MNQCDGCARGLPVKNGIHRGEGWDAIGCTKSRYPQPEDWPTDNRMNVIGTNGNDGDHYDELGLGIYLSAQDEVKQLRKEVQRLNDRLLREIKSKSSWKRKYEKFKPSRLVDAGKKVHAIDMIVAFDGGDKSKSMTEIAEIAGIPYPTLTGIARAYRQAII